MDYTFRNHGTCSTQVSFSVDDNGIVSNVRYVGGCNGNLQAVGRLVEGLHIDEVIKRLSGIRCGFKNTSCGDQLARALIEVRDGNK